jgi:pimeloyl-ACP methyl ester carboxylesterase
VQVPANGIELCSETHGDPDGEPVVLVCGIKLQLSSWSLQSDLLDALVSAGYRVITFDNRDVGYSTWVADPAPDLGDVLGGDLTGVNYTLWDLADDTAALLGELEAAPAHVVGHSMGGMVAQCLAIAHPDHVRTLTLWATNPGDGSGASSPAFLQRVLQPPPDDLDEAIEAMAVGHREQVVHPQEIDLERVRAYAREQLTRAPNPDAQHAAAVLATGDRSEGLRGLRCPTLVVHGDGDIAIEPDGGQTLARLVPGAELVVVEGMGHRAVDDKLAVVTDAVLAHLSGRG